MSQVFAWCREVQPTQPLTTPLWTNMPWRPQRLNILEKIQIEQSDIISFHAYGDVGSLKENVDSLTIYGKR
jgi:hypothetical protein